MPPLMMATRSDGGLFAMGDIECGSDGVPTIFNVPTTVEWLDASVVPIPIKTRNVTYPTPTEHLGQSIPGRDLEMASQSALAYYRTFLTDSEAKFVDGKCPTDWGPSHTRTCPRGARTAS